MKKLRLKPQDIMILFFLLILKRKWKYGELSKELNISLSEIHDSIKRAIACDLFDPLTRRPNRNSLVEFINFGIRHVFPVIPGEICKGIPTAHSADPLSKIILSEKRDAFVWETPEGNFEGYKIAPLYKSVPFVSKKYPEFYELLALTDALRIGKAREREIAKKELQERIATA